MTLPHPWNPDVARSIIHSFKHLEGPLLPVLHALQEAHGYLPGDAIPLIAGELGLSRAEVHGVISFYPGFRTEKPGRHIVQVCRAEACQAAGGRVLEQHVKQHLGLDYHQTSGDGSVTLEPVFCLGNCACGPSLRVDNDVYGRVDPAKAGKLLNALTARKGETP